MKKINLKRITNESVLDTYDDIINIAYSRNYSLFKNLINLHILENNFSDEYLSKTVSIPSLFLKKYYEASQKQILQLRDTLYDTMFNTINTFRDAVKTSYEQELEAFYYDYQMFYRTDKKFEDCFDGFDVKDQNFLDDFAKYTRGEMLGKKAEDFEKLIKDYFTYIDDTKYVMVFRTLEDILKKLQSDFNDEGYKTICYQKPAKNIALITRDEIKQLREMANKNYLSLSEVLKNQELLVKKLKKIQSKMPESQELKDELCKQTAKLNGYEELCTNVSKFDKQVSIFEERLDYANVKWKPNIIDKTKAKIKYSTKNPLARKIKWAVNEVYYHKDEANILEYYSRALDGINMLPEQLIKRAGGKSSFEEFEMPKNFISQSGEKEASNNSDNFEEVQTSK